LFPNEWEPRESIFYSIILNSTILEILVIPFDTPVTVLALNDMLFFTTML
jgi:hypothetical protein